MQHIENENEILQAATNTLQDNFDEFEVTPPSLGNLELVENYNGMGIPLAVVSIMKKEKSIVLRLML